jgi:hypothetical protein
MFGTPPALRCGMKRTLLACVLGMVNLATIGCGGGGPSDDEKLVALSDRSLQQYRCRRDGARGQLRGWLDAHRDADHLDRLRRPARQGRHRAPRLSGDRRRAAAVCERGGCPDRRAAMREWLRPERVRRRRRQRLQLIVVTRVSAAPVPFGVDRARDAKVKFAWGQRNERGGPL